METSDVLPKKQKRSFVEAWLTDDRYKSWICKVPDNDSMYHCIVCDKKFSCNTIYVFRHADSAGHRKKLQANSSPDNNVPSSEKSRKKYHFQKEWFDVQQYKLWLCDVPDNEELCHCVVCNKTFAAHSSHVRRHAESKCHLSKCKERGIEESDTNNFNTQDEGLLSFDKRKKAAEIKFAAFATEKNLSHQTAKDILSFFQHIDPDVLKSMSMGRTKCRNIISNVLCPVENKNVVHNLQRTKFSIFIDETSDISNEKWMTFFVRYVDPLTCDIKSQLVKLINIDARDSSAEKLFNAFKCEMWKMQIPFPNIISLSCDNASVMVGKHVSFKAKLQQVCKNLLTFPCPCHSAALAAHAACAQLPANCDEFLKKIANFINSSPKRTAIFKEFCECFQEKYRTILKLSDTRWLSHHACVERLLESWDTIKYFLQEMVVSDKIKSGEHLLSMMNNIDLKAYYLFLKYTLNLFNAYNAFFQSAETRIHLLQYKSAHFLYQMCKNFVKDEYMKDIATEINFSEDDIQKDINNIIVGSECQEYLDDLIAEGHEDIVTSVRHNILKFYIRAADEIRRTLPITDKFLRSLQVFGASNTLFDKNRESSFHLVLYAAKTFGGLDENLLRQEWQTLPADWTAEEKMRLSKLNFDDMWKEIVQRQTSNNMFQYPALRDLLSAIRSLPNSNADPERIFSILTDLKSKKRNKLSSTSVNATCVVKSALKTRDETATNLTITQEHLSRMVSDTLYADSPQKEKSSLSLYSVDEVAGPSSSTQL